MLSHKRVLFALASSAAVLALVAGWFFFKPTEQRIRIATPKLTTAAMLYVALDKGFFQDEGLTVELVEPRNAAIAVRDLMAGSVDVAIAPQVPVITAATAKQPIAILASIAQAEQRLGLVMPQAMRDVKDLRGKKVGVTRGTNAELLLRRQLRQAQMVVTDVQWVDLQPDQLPAALANGSVTAIFAFQPYVQRALTALDGSHLMPQEAGLIDVWMLLTTQAFEREHPVEIRRLLRAMLKAKNYIYAHSSESQAIVARHLGEPTTQWDPSDFNLRLFDFLPNTLTADSRMMDPLGAAPDFRKHISAEPLRDVAPVAVSLTQ